MGATAVVSSSATGIASSAASSSASLTSLLSPVGVGIGGIAVAILLLAVLAYYDVVSSRPASRETVERTLATAAVPLGVTFAGVVLFRTIQLL